MVYGWRAGCDGKNRKKILIAEVDTLVRDFLLESLSEDHNALAVADQDSLQEMLARERFDLILADLSLARWFWDRTRPQALRQPQQSPCILLGGNWMDECADICSTWRSGSRNYWLSKPFGLHELHAAVAVALGKGERPLSGAREYLQSA